MKKKKAYLIFSLLVLISAFGIIQYYIWGNAFITEYQSDCTDTLLWAQATLESGSLFKPTFDYAYQLAFGGQWLFMPFLKLFGLGMTALRAGMCLFTVLFTLILVLFFRALGHHRAESFFETGIMLLAMCATKKTREIFYGHIIHYSLAVFYLLLAFILLRLFLVNTGRRKQVIAALCFTLALFMCSANGTVEMLFVTLPLLAGCLIELYLHRDKKLIWLIVFIIIAAAAGFTFSKSLNTNYSDSYSVITPAERWGENLSMFPLRWISLFYQLPGINLDAFTSIWLKTVFRSIIALLMLAGVALSFVLYKQIEIREERLFLGTIWAMFAAFLYFFTFGKISDVDWRLSPLVFFSETVVLILCRKVLHENRERTLSTGLSLLCGVMLIINSLSNGFAVLRIPYDKKIWYAEDGLLKTLKAHGLDYGYITSYWLSNSITVLSNDTIRSRVVSIDENKIIYLNPFNSDLEWYNAQPGRDRYFLVLREAEFDPDMPEAKEASEIHHCIQEDTRNMRTDVYKILVFDHNIMQEEYEELLPRYQ